MKRFHVHVRVKDLAESTAFYKALFNANPSVQKDDYAKWMLDDLNVNFAISSGHENIGIEHLGIQAGSSEELKQVYQNMEMAKGEIYEEGECTCSKSQKSWITDPQGVDWEAFYTHGSATVYGEGDYARPAPEAMDKWSGNDGITVELDSDSCDTNCAIS